MHVDPGQREIMMISRSTMARKSNDTVFHLQVFCKTIVQEYDVIFTEVTNINKHNISKLKKEQDNMWMFVLEWDGVHLLVLLMQNYGSCDNNITQQRYPEYHAT